MKKKKIRKMVDKAVDEAMWNIYCGPMGPAGPAGAKGDPGPPGPPGPPGSCQFHQPLGIPYTPAYPSYPIVTYGVDQT